MVNLSEISLINLLTPNLLADENIRNAALSLDRELQDIASATSRLPLLANLDSLDEQWLDELLWQFHVEGIEFAETLDEKRGLIRNSIDVHRTKGTRYAIERILEILSMQGVIEEWWEFDGEPFTFRIDINIKSDRVITNEKLNLLEKLVKEYKNTRSHLTKIGTVLTTKGIIEYSSPEKLLVAENMPLDCGAFYCGGENSLC
ncbi:phage tail protein I [Brevibacillus fulvus]|uniref:Phage tail P2-like protein n=1 Tax=Brevibacillus fulvus TaxID=1125967 RepID=A0A939BR31_9BACL|nr:phage tail protein I [Brevibacillus fulvus]MBM7592245.1 phage tail P2-like protein [Brevibacillus fulvus]